MRKSSALLAVAVALWLAGMDARRLAGAELDPAAAAAAIDRLLEARLAEAGIPTSPPADHAEFLRRVTLDIVGRIPTFEETTDFLASDEIDKRRQLIDRLLESPAYGEHFATIWNELIVPRDNAIKKSRRDPFTPWLAEQFNAGRGWDQIVIDLLTVEGKIGDRPQAGFILANSEMSEPHPALLADATARLFWGVQLRCAECHDHPFAPWKQTDFWATAAFFSRLRKGYSDGKNPAGYTLTEAPPDEPVSRQFAKLLAAPGVAGPAIVVPPTGGKLAGQVVHGMFLGGAAAEWSDDGPFRERFAMWAVGKDNPWFAANAVNRLWAHFFGRGLVHPLDGFHAQCTPSHPQILDLLAGELVDSRFDLKHVIRIITSTAAYQRTSRPVAGNENDVDLVSHMAVKAMRPEVLYDSLSVVLDPPRPKPGSKTPGPGALAPLPGTPRDEFVRLFGTRPDETAGSIVNAGVPQFLKLLNGELLNQPTPGLERLLAEDPQPADAIKGLYLSALSRLPTAEELQAMEQYMAGQGDQPQAYGGVLWALVNSAEFVMNH
ncbi:MAG TPA: DUF1549 domain-containing protein [Pirellulaceae bacterium]|nr:DUF1549 domain-containing protein [Pirellulaceae bacterium]